MGFMLEPISDKKKKITKTFVQLFYRLCLLSVRTIKEDEGEMDHVWHDCLLSALCGHDLLLHMAI